jgi:hypothetical protein
VSEPRPTRAELAELGRSIEIALRPIRRAHPELVYAIAYGLPREGTSDVLAAATATNITDPQAAVVLLVHSAKEMQEQMVGPLDVARKPDD